MSRRPSPCTPRRRTALPHGRFLAQTARASDHRVTREEEGIRLRVLTPGAGGVAVCVDDEGNRSDVLTDPVGPVAPGDLLLVHAGTALMKLGRGGT